MTLTAHAPVPITSCGALPVLPAGLTAIECGWPGPGQDYETDRLDFVEILIRDAAATYVLTVEGSSLLDAGIAHGDLMVVDRGLEPVHNDVVLVDVDGDRILQRFLRRTPRRVHGAPAMPPQLSTALDARVWGVVTTCLHWLRAEGWASRPASGPADGLDLEALLVRDPVSTFVLRVSGSSMLDAGIAGGDRIIVDKGLSPGHGDVVLAVVDGQLCVKRFVATEVRRALVPQNPVYRELLITPEMDVRLWGVATICLHELRNWGHP